MITMLFALLMLSIAAPVLSRIDYTNHKVYSVSPSDHRGLKHLQKLYFDSFTNELDVWTDPVALYRPVNIRVPPHLSTKAMDEWTKNGLDVTTIVENLQEVIDKEYEENPPDSDEVLAAPHLNFRFDVYHTYDGISAYLDSVVEQSPLASIQVLGVTYKGEKIKGIKISSSGGNKPAVWIDACIHAREWIAAASATYMINRLITGYDSDSEIRKLVDTFDWYIIPVVNVDGYIFTWSENRLWRKNRVPSRIDSNCIGVDPNRNFDPGFGGQGTSQDPCSEIYPGEMAFSEFESRAISNGIKNTKPVVYISLHSYSQLIMFPYGYTSEKTPDYEDQMKAAAAASIAVKRTHNKEYIYGPIYTTIYPAAGASIDWAYATGGVKYSFTFELRDNGTYGFLLPNEQIIPTAEEIFNGVTAIVKYAKSEL